jgi:shikimate dehydrogenase
VIGIIGDPLGHSLSPRIHNAAFAHLGLDFVYVPFAVARDDLPAAVAGLRALGLRGANVTVPHKIAAAALLDTLDETAAALGAVNTIAVEGDLLHGHNTDVEGFARALGEVWRGPAAGKSALLLGAGGAARAAALALADLGFAITVVNRGLERALSLVETIVSARPGAQLVAAPLTALDAALTTAHDVLVNSTSLGMTGTGKVPAALADNVLEGQVVVDLVYGEGPTEFLTAARVQGAGTVDGLSMLVWQAAAAFELWTGVPAPVRVMRDAAERR